MWGAVLAAVTGTSAAREIEGVETAPTAKAAGETLRLNGAGVRTKLIFKVYVGALYDREPSRDAKAVLRQAGPKLMRMTLLRSVDPKRIVDSLKEGLEGNLTEEEQKRIKSRAEDMEGRLLRLGDGKEGDKMDLLFDPGAGTKLILNGKEIGAPIPGADFFEALLRVWIGEHPAQESLKRDLLKGDG